MRYKNYLFLGIYPSTRKDKKLMAKFFNMETGRDNFIHFGQEGASDFLINKDEERRKRYINRHKAREEWIIPITPATLSRYILWNKPTFKESLNDYLNRFFY
jgi:hypothetical protein